MKTGCMLQQSGMVGRNSEVPVQFRVTKLAIPSTMLSENAKTARIVPLKSYSDNSPLPSRTRSSRIFAIATLLVTAIVLATTFLKPAFLRPTVPNLEKSRQEISRLFQRGDFEKARQAADVLLASHPAEDDIRLIAAESAIRKHRSQKALQYLSKITSNQPSIALPAALLEAKVAIGGVADLRRAEKAFRAALAVDSENAEAHFGLVRLLAVCGRRREALPLLLNLVRMGHGSDQLTIAARGSGAVDDPDLLQRALTVFPNDSRVLLGVAVQAERFGKLDLAVEMCQKAIDQSPEFVPAIVDMGDYLLAAERFDDLNNWSNNLSDGCRQYAETWRVKGYLAEYRGELQQALSHFLKAAALGPELKDVQHRVSQLLMKAGDKAKAAEFANRLVQIQHLEAQQDRMFESGSRDAAVMITTINEFRELGRLWEAFGWAQVGLKQFPTDAGLQSVYANLAKETTGLPLTLMVDTENIALYVSASDYVLADEAPSKVEVTAKDLSPVVRPFSFRDDAAATGLNFVYNNGVFDQATHRMFEFTGGGIAVCDMDLDDFPDLFLTQGSLWETRGRDSISTDLTGNGTASDALFRNVRGQRFQNVSSVAGLRDNMFGQGVAAGDLNGDGFPDLFVSNIGNNAVWLNNGDGTFSNRSSLVADRSENETWTTSAVIADLNSDGNADIYAANYLQGDDIFDRVCETAEGLPRACIPIHFDGVRDFLYLNDGTGAFRDHSAALDAFDRGKSLGVAAWKLSANAVVSVLVANDTTPNMLINVSSNADAVVTDTGFESGLAVNSQGKSEGSMGIAVGDVNNDGLAELFITNFFNETNTFYQPVTERMFEDRTTNMNLGTASLPVLGFGTQFIDANMDGTLELIVANGYVDDLRNEGKAYQMPAQMFQLRNRVFELQSPRELGEYFTTDHLGRSVVCLDWNVDGLPDIAIGHLAENYALLTNTSSQAGHGISLKFVGTVSCRDAIGATVSYRLNRHTVTRQLSSGDGYHASNQHELCLAGGGLDEIKVLNVVWPSGQRQVLQHLQMRQRYVIVEGCATHFSLP